jgi:hypothetical protein
MNAVLFLAGRQLKNFVRQTVRNPGKLIVYLACVGLMAWMFIDLTLHPKETGAFADIRILEGLFLVWLLLLGTLTITTSLKSGSAVFRMSDVNLLFVSPTSPRVILIYGLARQMGATLLGFFFMLFYCGSLTNSFHVTPADVILLIALTAFFMILIQVVAMLAYGLIGGDPRRRAAVQGGVYAFITLMLLTALAPFVKGGGNVAAACAAAGSRSLEYFPVVGWTKGFAFAIMEGDAGRAALYGALMIASLLLCILLFLKSTPDYYEDVLEKAEKTFALGQAKREKRGLAAAASSGPKKVGKTGLGRGWGANAFFYKQLCEARRRSRFVFFSTSTVLMLVMNLGLYGVMLLIGSGKNPIPTHFIMAIACGVSTYILFFLNAAGDWSRELLAPYIYLAPEPPFKKLLWASMTTLLKPVFDGIVLFGVTGLVVRASLSTVLICILLYASFGCLFTAGNVLAKRIFGGMANRGIVLVLYMPLLIAIAAPGIGGMIGVYFAARALPESVLPFLMGLPTAGWNLLVSGVVFYLCRNLLASAEMN